MNARHTFTQLLDWGVIPVVNENDTVAVQELRFGDNDALASLLLNPVEGDLFVNLTSTGGVLAENPLTSPDPASIPLLESIDDIRALDLDALCGGKTGVGTGGMYSKLLSARRAAQLGVPTLILPGPGAGYPAPGLWRGDGRHMGMPGRASRFPPQVLDGLSVRSARGGAGGRRSRAGAA